MADERSDPRSRNDPAGSTRPDVDRIPGQRDMSLFERVFAGPAAQGPRPQWTITWPDGRTVGVDSEDTALEIARGAPGCRVAWRYVTPWEPSGHPSTR